MSRLERQRLKLKGHFDETPLVVKKAFMVKTIESLFNHKVYVDHMINRLRKLNDDLVNKIIDDFRKNTG